MRSKDITMPRKNISAQEFNPIGKTSGPLYLATKEELAKLDTKVTFLNNISIAVGIVVTLGFIGVVVALGAILRDHWESKENSYINYTNTLERNNLLFEQLTNEMKMKNK